MIIVMALSNRVVTTLRRYQSSLKGFRFYPFSRKEVHHDFHDKHSGSHDRIDTHDLFLLLQKQADSDFVRNSTILQRIECACACAREFARCKHYTLSFRRMRTFGADVSHEGRSPAELATDFTRSHARRSTSNPRGYRRGYYYRLVA